jgi:hypothetical protein
MSKRLSYVFVNLTQDALLKAFWRKAALRAFLQQHGISGTDLAQWYTDQTKRAYVEWLWSRLVETDRGQNAILDIARTLSEMRHFPDLEGKEDTKVRVPEAEKAIARLREAVRTVNEAIHETKQAEIRRQAALAESAARATTQQTLDRLQGRLVEITARLGTQPGGYDFESWFYDLARHGSETC